MKWIVASDIHGSAKYARRLIEAYTREEADRLLLLGDILYHGPRNDLPPDYDPKQVVALLSPLKERIFCVRGNCDTEVDQMVLEFPILAEYCFLSVDGVNLFATHGHQYGPNNPPPLNRGDFLLCGHFHLPIREEREGYDYLNPGSLGLPKENLPHSYMTLDQGVFTWRDAETGEAFQPRRHG